MGLNVALVDRGRRLVDTPMPSRVEGTTRFETVRMPWFKCRLTLQAAPEADDAQGGRRRVPRPATLLMGRRDVDGNELAMAPTDKVEVVSKALGRYVFEVTGDPEPIRKRRKLLGWTTTLTLVEEHEFVRTRR